MESAVWAIAGGSGSGKSTLIRQLCELLGRNQVCILAMDDYYRDLSHLSLEQRELFNFDSPDAIDCCLFVQSLDQLREGRSVESPIYDFSQHTRCTESRTLAPSPVILVDGIMALAFEDLRERYDLSIFLKVDEQLRFERRLKRDTLERGRTESSVRKQWESTVVPCHQRIVEPSAEFADLIVQTQDFKSLLDSLALLAK